MADISSIDPAAAPVRVLLVEDEDAIRGVLARVLRREGYDVTEASSGEDALACFRQRSFPLVVTDIVMRGMTGLELLGELRLLDEHTVTVIMTSHASFEAAREALRAGAYDFLTKPFDDLSVVATVINRAAEKIVLEGRNERLLSELRQHAGKLEALNSELATLAIRDGMTGLFNHRHFRETLEQEIRRCRRHEHRCSLLFADVDHFKQYNDRHGHLAGDELLRAIAELLERQIRRTSVAARYGGEEFVVLLPETDSVGAGICAEKIRSAAENELPVTLSIGVATFPEHGQDGDAILERADRALYMAKEQGRNRVVVVVAEPEPAR